MDWGELADATVLFPSFSGTEDGALPDLPTERPVWTVLDPANDTGLKAQMANLQGGIACSNPGFFVRGEGVIVDATATVEAGAYLIGPVSYTHLTLPTKA